jgi:hypothetical protein
MDDGWWRVRSGRRVPPGTELKLLRYDAKADD